jgi:hypothetical protein
MDKAGTLIQMFPHTVWIVTERLIVNVIWKSLESE